MVEIPFIIVLTMCLQIYILAAICFLTYRIVTPRLSKIPGSFIHQDYATKRGLFIIHIGFFEMVFVLIVHVELSHRVISLVQPTMEKRCSELGDSEGLDFISYLVLSCILMYVARCLVQSYVLQRLSKTDVLYLTKVYLLPSMCFIALLCVRLWFHLYEKADPSQPVGVICYQKVNWSTATVKHSPLTFYMIILAFITIAFVYDFVASDDEQERKSPSYLCSELMKQQRTSMKQPDTNTKQPILFRQPTHLQITLINDSEQTSQSLHIGDEVSRTQEPIRNSSPGSTNAAKIEKSIATSDESGKMHLLGDTLKFKAPSTCGSRWEFLPRSVRLYSGLVVYFTIFIGCYQCTEYLLFGSFFEDFAPVIFTSVVIINGVISTVQIPLTGTVDDEKTHDVVNCKNNQSSW